MEASSQRALPVLLLCFHFDPTTGRYTLAIMKVLQLAGLMTVLTVAGTLSVSRSAAKAARDEYRLFRYAPTSAPETDYLLLALAAGLLSRF